MILTNEHDPAYRMLEVDLHMHGVTCACFGCLGQDDALESDEDIIGAFARHSEARAIPFLEHVERRVRGERA